jgi:hypothetical protein
MKEAVMKLRFAAFLFCAIGLIGAVPTTADAAEHGPDPCPILYPFC